ncbi:hypothetical protein NC651_037969 [Populus alba x Populus x berolinensis]|nr:hypothetical protein NC651_037841 [Populus alba x Populus x berolinensis]KAJ6856238.1 hypothetical protein NC651_037969 [Populus alba x Populus x berolinensis]
MFCTVGCPFAPLLWTPLMVARSWHRNELGVILTTQQENQSQICPSPYISIPFMSIVKIARYSSLRMLSVMHKNIRIASDPVLLEVAVANAHWVNESRKHQTMKPLKLLENGSPKELQGVLIKRFYSKNLKG